MVIRLKGLSVWFKTKGLYLFLDAFISYALNSYSVLNSRSYINGLYVVFSLITTILHLYASVAESYCISYP